MKACKTSGHSYYVACSECETDMEILGNNDSVAERKVVAYYLKE